MIVLHLSELEARALVETVNRAWSLIPTKRVRDAVNRASTRIEGALAKQEAA